jgi:lipoprotein-releasing system permease protein
MVSPAASFYAAWRLLTGPSDSKRRKRHALGAILGVAFSLVPLIVVQQVSSGMIEGISRRFLEIGSFHLQAKQFIQGERGITETAELLSDIEGVTLAMPIVEGLGIAYSADGRNGVSVRGLPASWLENDPYASSYLQWDEGRFRLEERDHLLISREAARILDVGVGDQITLLTAFEQPGRGTMMKPSRFIVQGIFSTGYYELDTLTVYISYERAVTLFPDLWSGSVAVKIVDPFGDYGSMQQEIAGTLGTGWRVYTWYDLQRPMFESFKTTRTLLVFIMVLIVLIASFSITSAVVMMVMEHEQEIAMLKSTGVNSYTIEQLFLILGLFIGASGL